MIHTFVHRLCKGKRPTDLGWIWQVGECSQQPVSKRNKWSETMAVSSWKESLRITMSVSLILPAPRRDFWPSHKVHQCWRQKAGNQGWQISSGRPVLGEQCCFGHTWRNKEDRADELIPTTGLLIIYGRKYVFGLCNYMKNIRDKSNLHY